MSNLIIKARIKLVIISILISGFIFLSTGLLRGNIIYQASLFSLFILYYLIRNREGLSTFLNFAKFLAIMIILLHSLFFIYKWISMGFDFTRDFYLDRGTSILIRIFIIPNIFAFVNILISKVSFIEIMLIAGNSKQSKILYILMISGIEVMERLRIHYEYHPLNWENRGLEKIIHYLAVPLTLFFGIYRGFEKKLNSLEERNNILRGKK